MTIGLTSTHRRAGLRYSKAGSLAARTTTNPAANQRLCIDRLQGPFSAFNASLYVKDALTYALGEKRTIFSRFDEAGFDPKRTLAIGSATPYWVTGIRSA